MEKTFSGEMETELICTRCNKGRRNQDKFNYVFLNIPKQEGKITLEENFRELEKEEKIDVNCIYCAAGKKARKRCRIREYPPKALIIHLKRYGEDGKKNTRLVHYSLIHQGYRLVATMDTLGTNKKRALQCKMLERR